MITFEVKALREGRWILDSIHEDEAAARKRAKEVLASKQWEAVQATKERRRSDGTYGSTVIMEAAGDVRAAPIGVVPIDDAPFCATPDDLYAFEARATVWRLLRKYLELSAITPSELLHHYRSLSRLIDFDPPVFPAAVDRVATLHARMSDTDPKARRDTLYAWVDGIAAKAREVEREKSLHKHGLADLPALAAEAEYLFGPSGRDHAVRCTIARALVGTSSFYAKLEMLLLAVRPDLPADLLAVLDGFVADTLGSATAIQDLLGARGSLCEALIALIDLMEGKAERQPPPTEPDVVKALRALLASGVLPEGGRALLERVKTQVAAKQPLDRQHPEREDEAFSTLMQRLMTAQGIIGGPTMAEALTQRCGRRFVEGGRAGQVRAVDAMMAMIRDPLQRLRYLCSIAGTDTGLQAAEGVRRAVQGVLHEVIDLHDLVHPRLTAPKKLAMITDIQRLILASDLEDDLRLDLVRHFDDLLADFMRMDPFIERLDDQSLSLRQRALRMIKFCSSGLLLEGKALEIARNRVVAYLRQPNFVESFTADCASPAEAEQAIRELHLSLADAGFKR